MGSLKPPSWSSSFINDHIDHKEQILTSLAEGLTDIIITIFILHLHSSSSFFIFILHHDYLHHDYLHHDYHHLDYLHLHSSSSSSPSWSRGANTYQSCRPENGLMLPQLIVGVNLPQKVIAGLILSSWRSWCCWWWWWWWWWWCWWWWWWWS